MALVTQTLASMADGQVTVALVYDDTTNLAVELTATNDTTRAANGYLNGVTMTIPPGGLAVPLPLPGHAPVDMGALAGGLQWGVGP